MAGIKKHEYILSRLDDIEKMAREGNTEKEIAQALNVATATFYKYKKQLPELREALDKGYSHSLKKVEAALFKAACGYTFEEVTEERDSKGNMIITKKVKKEVQPNVSAIMNILKNKLNNEWNTAEKVDITGKIEGKNVLADVPTEDVAKMAAAILKKKKAGENDV